MGIVNVFEISNRVSGQELGGYAADSEEEALDALARDAGYEDYDDMCATVGGRGELVCKLQSVVVPDLVGPDGVPIDPELVKIVEDDARNSAELFVEEHGSPWDDETDGDWDSTAYECGNWEGRADEVRRHHEVLWPHWSRVFRAETERLCS